MFGLFRTVQLILFFSFLLSACKSENANEINQQLILSLKEFEITTKQSTESELRKLENQTFEPITKDRASRWHQIAATVHSTVNDLFNLIDTLSKKKTTEEELSIIYKKTLGFKSLTLEKYQEYFNEFNNEFKNLNPIFSIFGIDSSGKISGFKNSERNNELLLATLKNKIRMIENKLIRFCNSRTDIIIDDYQSFSAIIGQNANVLSPGSELEIFAGMGAFSFSAKPKISFGETIIPLNESGYASFKTKVSDKTGNYKIPVSISYFNQTTGKDETKLVNIEYKVVKLCD